MSALLACLISSFMPWRAIPAWQFGLGRIDIQRFGGQRADGAAHPLFGDVGDMAAGGQAGVGQHDVDVARGQLAGDGDRGRTGDRHRAGWQFGRLVIARDRDLIAGFQEDPAAAAVGYAPQNPLAQLGQGSWPAPPPPSRRPPARLPPARSPARAPRPRGCR